MGLFATALCDVSLLHFKLKNTSVTIPPLVHSLLSLSLPGFFPSKIMAGEAKNKYDRQLRYIFSPFASLSEKNERAHFAA